MQRYISTYVHTVRSIHTVYAVRTVQYILHILYILHVLYLLYIQHDLCRLYILYILYTLHIHTDGAGYVPWTLAAMGDALSAWQSQGRKLPDEVGATGEAENDKEELITRRLAGLADQ